MKNLLIKNTVYRIGLLLAIISSATYYLFLETRISSDFVEEPGLFFVLLAISIVFLVMTLWNYRIQNKEERAINRHNFTLFGYMLLLAAFSLNEEMQIFHTLVPWLKYSLWIIMVNLVLMPYMEHFPMFIRHIQNVILGAGILVFLYFTLYLLPLIPLSVVFIWFFGITMVTFAPLVLLLVSFSYLNRSVRSSSDFRYALTAGMLVPILALTVFIVGINQAQRKINYAINDNQIAGDRLYPTWMEVAKHVPSNMFVNTVLQYNLTFNTQFWDDFGFDLNRRNIGELQYHDPVVILASMFSRELNLSQEDRIRVLETNMDVRHYTQERLWRGKDLKTTNVVSHVRLYPSFRMSYTEKTLNISNFSKSSSRPQEAIYTFHMPEGTTVSSLSLWINGKEEKGYLTAKGKADSAYKTIVGIESRDPSLVHWQEGNRVSVRVFPCTKKEPRKVKIGFTSPLRLVDERLIYENIYFEGPSAKGATESVYLDQLEGVKNMQSAMRFKPFKNQIKVYRGNYKPEWKISMDASELSGDSFAFQGHRYTVSEDVPEYKSLDLKSIYLDVDKHWSKSEFNEIWEFTQSANVYVYNGGLIKLTEDNKEDQFDMLTRQNFSLFPLFAIDIPEKSMIITKGGDRSPLLSEIKESRFASRLTEMMKKRPGRPYLFHFGSEMTPFQKSLNELRLVRYMKGDLSDLKTTLDTQKFIVDVEDDHTVRIPSAGLLIHETEDSTQSGSAPDHLLRLYTYNHLMSQLNKDYFEDDLVREDVVKEAQWAHVVSPVSSLVVLESQADYDRFDIKKPENSLGNASMKNAGSVPEPHEWLLMILGTLVIFWMTMKNRILAFVRR